MQFLSTLEISILCTFIRWKLYLNCSRKLWLWFTCSQRNVSFLEVYPLYCKSAIYWFPWSFWLALEIWLTWLHRAGFSHHVPAEEELKLSIKLTAINFGRSTDIFENWKRRVGSGVIKHVLQSTTTLPYQKIKNFY